MKQKVKYLLSAVLALYMVFGLSALQASASEASPAGTGSKENPWVISAVEGTDDVKAWFEGSEQDGYTIFVAGTGRMTDSFRSIDPPWKSIKQYITAVEIGEGVTNVGAYAFNFCRGLKSVSLPESLTEIGAYAFHSTGIKRLVIPEAVTTIGRMIANPTTYYEVLGNPANVNDHAFSTSLVSVADPAVAEPLNAKTHVLAIIVLDGGIYGKTDEDLANLSYGLIAPEKEGFTFGGWYQSADFSGQRCAEDDKGRTAVNINHVYYAKWEEASVTPTPTPTATPTPTEEPTPTESPVPTEPSVPAEPTPTEPAVPSETPGPTEPVRPTPSETPEPTEPARPTPTEPAVPSETPGPTEPVRPNPTEPAVPSETPGPTEPVRPTPSETPEPTEPAEVSPAPGIPNIKDDKGKNGWEIIKEEIAKADIKDTVSVEMNGATQIQGDVLDSIKGKDITVVFEMENDIIWSVNGTNITEEKIGNIDLKVEIDTDHIPEAMIQEVAKEGDSTQLTLSHTGSFGFTAQLSINMGKDNAGRDAVLYYHNADQRKMEWHGEDRVGNGGWVSFLFTHASDYVIVLSKETSPDVTETPEPDVTESPNPTKEPNPTDAVTPAPTSAVTTPAVTPKPDITEEPKPTGNPAVTEPVVTEQPSVSGPPEETDSTDTPATGEQTPAPTETPADTEEPDPTGTPEATKEPDQAETPAATKEPDQSGNPADTDEPSASRTPQSPSDENKGDSAPVSGTPKEEKGFNWLIPVIVVAAAGVLVPTIIILARRKSKK